MSIRELMREHPPAPPAARGTIANTPASADDELYVTLESYDAQQRFGPCPFMPRGAELPQRGDSCLVLFDETREPWVVVWS